MVAEGPSLAGFHFHRFDRADTQSRLAQRDPIDAGSNARDYKVTLLISCGARHFAFALAQDHGHVRGRTLLNTHLALDGAGGFVLRETGKR